MIMQVKVEVVDRHVHLTQADIETLFGAGFSLKKIREIGHGLEYLAEAVVKIIGPGAEFINAAVWGPAQNFTQVELSKSDCEHLGIQAPMRLSGKIESSGRVKLAGPKGEIELEKGVIVPKRHLHLSAEQAREWGLKDSQNVSVTIMGERGATFHKVEVRVQEDAQPVVHLERDEANAVWLENEAEGEIENRD